MSSFRPAAALAVSSLVFLAACADPAYLEQNPGGNQERGALAGAAAGALLGNAIAGPGNRTTGAVVGAVGGAIVGAAIGADLDRQAAELRGDFSNSEIDVIRQGDQLIVRMPQDILFAVDSSTVNAGLRSDLGILAASLNKYPETRVIVTGHTDNTGSAGYNQTLSENRAVEVSSILIGNGVSARRVTAVGAGEDSPIASNLTPEGRAQNRRVDITIQAI